MNINEQLQVFKERWNNGDSKFVDELLDLAEQQAQEIERLKYDNEVKTIRIFHADEKITDMEQTIACMRKAGLT